MSFTLCPSCHRHVKTREPRCPFCKAAVGEAARSPLGTAVVLGLGLAVAGCSSSTTTPNEGKDASPAVDSGKRDTGTDANMGVMYGPPSFDAGMVDARPKDAGHDANMVVAYGPPDIFDAGATDAFPSGAYGPPAGDF